MVLDTESGAEMTQGFKVYVDSWQSLEATTSLSYDRTEKTFTLKTKHNVSYTLTDKEGVVVGSGKLEPVPELVIDMASLSADEYLLKLHCEDEIKEIRIINNK